MVSRYYYLYIITGLAIIIGTAILGSYQMFGLQNLILGYLLISFAFFEAIGFVAGLNSINKKIASFFNAVHNQDTSIQLPQKTDSRAIKEIYKGMNKAIDIFQEIKIAGEIREKLFLAMIEHSTTGFISIDQHGDFEIMNHMARKLLGVEYTSNLQRMEFETPEFYNVVKSLLPGESKSCRISHKGYTSTVQVALSKLNYQDKNLTLVSLLDIQKEIDARELESWQKLIRIMNHEIMNSIAPITSAAKTLTKIFVKDKKSISKYEVTEKTIQDTVNCLDVIETMSSGLTYFVENYRRLSKIPEPDLKKIDIQKWGNTLKKILPEFVLSEDTIEIDISHNLKTFLGDERLLNQVIINLVRNASDAPLNNENKKISVKIDCSIKKRIEIKVWNNGKDIDEEYIDKIFIPFFTTKENGAGIGLYLSKQIINSHNGSLSVVSGKDGTCFIIQI